MENLGCALFKITFPVYRLLQYDIKIVKGKKILLLPLLYKKPVWSAPFWLNKKKKYSAVILHKKWEVLYKYFTMAEQQVIATAEQRSPSSSSS